MAKRFCAAQKEKGEPCQQAPLRESDFCFWHDPGHAKEAAEARRLGGLRRKREHTIAAAYLLEGLDSVAGLRRLLEIATVDVISVDQPIPRARVLIAAVSAGAKLLEVGDFNERLQKVEAALFAPALAVAAETESAPEGTTEG